MPSSCCQFEYSPLPTSDPDLQPRQIHVQDQMIAQDGTALPHSTMIESVIRELRIPGMSKTTIWADSMTAFRPCCLLVFGSLLERIAFQITQLLLLTELVFVPFVIAFSPIYPLEQQKLVCTIDFGLSALLFFFTVPVRLRTSIVSIKTRKEIVSAGELFITCITEQGFWLDILAAAGSPWLYIGGQDGKPRELQLLALFRLFKLHRFGRPTLRDQLLGSEPFHIRYIRVVVTIFVVAHLFACTWFYAKMSSPIGFGHEWTAWNGWGFDALDVHDVDYAALALKIEPGDANNLAMHYFRALKDGIYMLIGWGGPDAMSFFELAAVLILGPCSSMVAGLILSKLIDINSKRGIRETQYENKMAMVYAACDGLLLPQDLRDRVDRYHSYLHFHQLDTDSQDMLFSGLSVNLLAEVRVHMARSVLDGTSFFEGLPARLLSFLVVSFDEVVFSPGDLIIRKNEVGDTMYIVTRGSAKVCLDEALQMEIKTLTEGSFFGEISLVFPFPRTAFIYAFSYIVLMQLDKDKFDNVLQTAPEEKKSLLVRIIKNVKSLVPDLEKVMCGTDKTRADQAKQVLGQLSLDFKIEGEDSSGGTELTKKIGWGETDFIPPATPIDANGGGSPMNAEDEAEMLVVLENAAKTCSRGSVCGLSSFRRHSALMQSPMAMESLECGEEDEEDSMIKEKLSSIESRMSSLEDLMRSFVHYARSTK